MKTNTERRKFFKKTGLGAVSAAVLSLLPFKLFARFHDESKNAQSKVNITINPMAVKRKKRK